MRLFKRKSPRLMEKRICANCGKEFIVNPSRIELSHSGLVFCSAECSGKYTSERANELNAQCFYCGKVFHRSPANFRPSNTYTYCSRECYDNARKDGIADKRKPKNSEHQRTCEHCGKSFTLKHSVKNYYRRKFCSDECERQHRIITGSYVPREYMKGRNQRCEICGLEAPEILEVHHKDRNRRNNKLDNLILVCPNCHAKIHRGVITL